MCGERSEEILLGCYFLWKEKRTRSLPLGYKLGTLVFKDVETKKILIWKHIQSELVQDYKYLKEELLNRGYTITSTTLDGKRDLYKAFKDIPIQMCHFHQKKIVQRYITMRPKLEVGKELKKLVSRLTMTTEKNFTQKLDEWYHKYQVFLDGEVPLGGKNMISLHRGLSKNMKLNLVDYYLVNYKKNRKPCTHFYY